MEIESGFNSATSGEKMATTLANALQMPKEVAAISTGKRILFPTYAIVNAHETPNFEPRMNRQSSG